MESAAVLPYFHPCNVLLIDDSVDVLHHYSLQLSSLLAVQLFNSPVKALEYLNNSKRPAPLYERCRPLFRDGMSESELERLLQPSFNFFENEPGNPQRFDEIAVVVVDYAMPSMDGITFCRQIENLNIRKILLTGKGSADLAVTAFNTDAIDRFVSKQDYKVLEILNDTIEELQQAYFREICSHIEKITHCEFPRFLQDNEFQRRFTAICKERGIVEYYLTWGPNGFLLITETGALSRLVVLTEEDMVLHERQARSRNAPEELVKQLHSKKVVPYFWQSEGIYFAPACTRWPECLYKASVISGANENYYYAVIDDVPDYKYRIKEIQSYGAYLEQLDVEQHIEL